MLGLGHFETSVAFRKHFDDQFQHYKEQVGDLFVLIKALPPVCMEYAAQNES